MVGDPWLGVTSSASMPMRIIGPPRAGAALVWKAGSTPRGSLGRSQAASQVQARAKSAMRFMVLSPKWTDDFLTYREKPNAHDIPPSPGDGSPSQEACPRRASSIRRRTGSAKSVRADERGYPATRGLVSLQELWREHHGVKTVARPPERQGSSSRSVPSELPCRDAVLLHLEV